MRIVLLVISLVVAIAAPAVGQEGEPGEPAVPYLGPRVTITPHEGSVLSWNGRRYAGDIEIKAGDGGLVVVEHVSLDDYLLGIQEVPFSWESEALRAQAVAARTYLAWTLSRGRAGAGATYGFDICATDQCQVYGGLGQVEGADGPRWAAAVEATSNEILLYNGAPAQALYSSTAGPRTRSVEDVFGSSAIPYLQAVASPGETSPYVSWTLQIPEVAMVAVMRDAGLIDGVLRDVAVTTKEDGEGAWIVSVVSSGGTETLSTWRFRRVMNASGPRVRSDLFPAERPDGRKYPQTILSPTYEISREWVIGDDFTTGYVPASVLYTIEGNGWGHQVGMSQYGAQAMASSGFVYDEILGYYYGGLQPSAEPGVLPDVVQVGLAWGLEEVTIEADGPYDVLADGEILVEGALGAWTMAASGNEVLLAAPEGYGFPPSLNEFPEESHHEFGFAIQLVGHLSVKAETRFAVFRGAELVEVSNWVFQDAGRATFFWSGNVDGDSAPPGKYQFVLFARSAGGRDVEVVDVVIDP